MSRPEDLEEYFESEEFKAILAKYETMKSSGANEYFDVDDLNDIASYYASQNLYEDSKEAVEYTLYLYPGNIDATIFKSRNAIIDGDIDEAQCIIDSIEDQEDVEVLFVQAELCLARDEQDKAQDIFLMIASTELDNTNTMADMVSLMLDYQAYELATHWLKRLLKKEKNFRYYMLMIDTMIEQENLSAGEMYLKEALDEYPYSEMLWEGLSNVQFLLAKFDECVESAEFALAINPDSEALQNKAQALYITSKWQAAEESFSQYLKKHPDAINSKIMIAMCHFNMNDGEKCLELLLKCYDEIPESDDSTSPVYKPNVELHIGICYNMLKKPDESDYWMNRAIENGLGTDESKSLIEAVRGDNCYLRGDKEKSIQHYRQAIEGSKDKLAILFGICMSMSKNGEMDSLIQFVTEYALKTKNDDFARVIIKLIISSEYGEDTAKNMQIEKIAEPLEYLKKMMLQMKQKEAKREDKQKE